MRCGFPVAALNRNNCTVVGTTVLGGQVRPTAISA
jgi:hypothetical protein